MDQAATILAARTAARMSQEHLATAAGVSTRTLIRAEQGHNVSVESLRAICAALDLDARTLQPVAVGPVPGDGEPLDLSQPIDWPELSTSVDMLAANITDNLPGRRLVLRPDVVALRRAYNRSQNLTIDPARRHYFDVVTRIWLAMWIGSLVSILTVCVLIWQLSGPIGDGGIMYAGVLGLLTSVIYFVAMPIVDWHSRVMARHSAMAFALDQTHLHEFVVQRSTHPRWTPTIRRRSVRVDRITSVGRRDEDGFTSFDVETEAGRFRMPCIIPTERASEVERLLGSIQRGARPHPVQAQEGLVLPGGVGA